MTSVTLGLVGLAVVALVVIGAQRLGLVAKADAPVASAATASELPVETHDLSHYTDPGEFPSDAEAALLEKLQSEVAMRCERADPVEVPEFYFRPTRPNELPGTMELGIRAGVNCLTGQVRVIYWQASASPGGADELFFNLVLKRSIPPGDCAADKRAYADWSAGAHDGHVMCYTVPAGSVLEWSYSAANIYAIATRRDGDSAALYKWWRDIGRLLSR